MNERMNEARESFCSLQRGPRKKMKQGVEEKNTPTLSRGEKIKNEPYMNFVVATTARNLRPSIVDGNWERQYNTDRVEHFCELRVK